MTTILYRLPEEETIHELLCERVEKNLPLAELGKREGYAFVPYNPQGKSPTLLYLPDECRRWRPSPDADGVSPLSFSSDEAERHSLYLQEFDECMRHLSSGRLSKIVLSRGLRLTFRHPLSPEALRVLYVRACRRYPHSFVSLIFNNSAREGWFIATPEVLLEHHEGRLRTMALAATMSLDEAGELPPGAWSPKNREEQRIVARYIASRLTDLDIPFTTSSTYTRKAGGLVHLCTDFFFDADHEIGPIVAALHPTPAVCGLPARQASHLIDSIEHHDRQYYAGFSGPIGLSSGTHLFVTLRCMHIEDDSALLFAGGGLLPESEVESEWLETQRKLNTMLNVLQ